MCDHVTDADVQLVLSAQPNIQDLVQLADALLPNCFALVDSCLVRLRIACQLLHAGIFRTSHFCAVLLLSCLVVSFPHRLWVCGSRF